MDRLVSLFNSSNQTPQGILALQNVVINHIPHPFSMEASKKPEIVSREPYKLAVSI